MDRPSASSRAQRGGSHGSPWREICRRSCPGFLPPPTRTELGGNSLKVARMRRPPRVRWTASSHWCARLAGAQERDGLSTQASGKADAARWSSRLRVPPRLGPPGPRRRLKFTSSSPHSQPSSARWEQGPNPAQGSGPGSTAARGRESSRSPTAPRLKPRRPLKPAVFSFYFQKLTSGRWSCFLHADCGSFQGSRSIRSISCTILVSFFRVTKASLSASHLGMGRPGL